MTSTKGNPQGIMNRHKAMAEGQQIEVMAKGGKVHKDEKQDKKLIREEVKASALKGNIKQSGHIKKRGR